MRGTEAQASVLIADLAVRQPTERLLARALEAACHHRLLELDFARAHKAVKDSSGMGQLSDMEGGYAAYRISKTALNAVTAILAAELRGAVAVNAVCPGWVKTDMGGKNAEREVSQGAAGAVWLALDAPQDFTGNFTRDRKVIPW